MRPISSWFLLLQTLSLASAGSQGNGAPSEDGSSVLGHAPAMGAFTKDRSEHSGNDVVDDIVSALTKRYPPIEHRKRKSDGIISIALSYALKAVPTFRISAPPDAERPTTHKELSGFLGESVRSLEHLAKSNDPDALYVLGQMNFYGNFTHPRNFEAAFGYYHRLTELYGNNFAQYMLGFMYSTGIGGAVERDQARALLYYTFAANGGNTRAAMTVAHRYHTGIGTIKNCDTAVKYYKQVADKAVAWYRSGPPGGMSWIQESLRIADEDGGVYGEGASVSSAGINAKQTHPNHGAYASIDDIIEYWDLMSQKGDFKASFNLGRAYYDGQRGLPQDFELARKYFLTVTSRFWKRGGRVADQYKPGLDKIASKSAGYMGRIYLRGEGVEQSFSRAKSWFDRGIQFGDAQSQYGLGLMLLHGYGNVPKNVVKAGELFKAAAEQDYHPALVQLGALYLDQGYPDDIGTANHYFELAARYGNLEAWYYLGEMNLVGVGREKSCARAVEFYKNVAERAEPFVSSWAEANLAYEAGDHELALLEYLGLAEQGYEKAQNNVAFMLDPKKTAFPLLHGLLHGTDKPDLLQNPTLALIYWTRSSKQGNIDSLVKMGDYYLDGVGTQPDIDKAVQCYTGAAEYQQSAQALYNLAWMHENGVGLNQDFHLAKRYYDTALETNSEAKLPVKLSLLKLRARSAWNTFTHGRVNSIQDEPSTKKDWSLSEWIANFVQDDLYAYYDDLYDDGYDDMPGGDGNVSGDGVDEDGILESLVIVGLAAALVFLVMYRQQRQAQARREEEERRGGGGAQQQQPPAPPQQQQQVPAAVFFGGPGGPEWIPGPGGVGH